MTTIHPSVREAAYLMESGRKPEALLLLNQLAARNEPSALATLANFKWGGGADAPDPAQGRELYRRAAEAGHPKAGIFYTNLLANGVAGPRDWPQAMRRLALEAANDPQRREIAEIIGRMKLTEHGNPETVPDGETLSTSPSVIIFRHLFSAGECEYLRKAAEPLYQPSIIFDEQRRPARDPVRTSDGGTIHWLIEDPLVHALNRRLAAVTGTAAEQGEAVQILRYRPGQQYRSHFDFVVASENQRTLTALVYLNHDYKGGETCFVKTGLKIRGRKGDALVFRNAGPDRRPDSLSEHAGLPVTSGTKYLASRWIRENRWAP
jgi:prolyl 4-hydroxylase